MSLSVIVYEPISKEFEIGRGCRQGDPLSPYLFVLCAKILPLSIKNNKNIVGITVDEIEFKLTQYADDTTLILDGSPESLNEVFKTLHTFRTCVV